MIKESYQDPTTEETAWLVVDLKPVRKLKRPVSLAQVKAEKRLEGIELVRLGRLSVQSVKENEWKVIMEMAGEDD